MGAQDDAYDDTTDMDEKTVVVPPNLTSTSSTEAASDAPEKEHPDPGSEKEHSSRRNSFGPTGEPDIDHDEIEAIVPGHALDVELEKGIYPIASHTTARSRVSRVLSLGRAPSRAKERIPFEPLPETDLDAGIVGWDSQTDPSMPFNFSRRDKWLVVGLLSIATLVTPFASSILSPGIAALDEEFGNDDSVLGAMTVSIYLLGYCVGPLFLAPLSEIYGRKVVLGAANAFFCAWQIGCALAPGIGALIVFRFFSGVGGAGCLTLGAGVISDVFRTDERGFAMGIYTLGPLFGPTIGPLIGGYLSQTIGWRWDFWIVLIVSVIITALIELFNKETNPRVLIERKVRRLRKELGRDDLRSCYEPTGAHQPKSKSHILLNGLIRPTKMLIFSPLLFSLSLYIAFTYGVLYLLFTTIPIVFEEQYGWSVGTTGLVYIALGFGNLIGWAVVTARSDRGVVKRTKANGGVFEPEMRLPISIYFGFFLPITFFWYGWSTYYKTHWISPVLSLIPFAFGLMGLYLPIITYLVDCYPMYAASAIAANTVLRSLVGALLPLAGPTMYKNMGLGWGNSLLGFICVGMIPVPMMIYKYGGRLRKAEKLQL